MKKHSYLYLAGLALAMATSPWATVKANTEPVSPETGTSLEAVNAPTASSTDLSATPASEELNTGEQAVDAETQITSMIDDMSTRQKITQMLMPDFRKWQTEGSEAVSDLTVVNEEIAEAIDGYDFGGVILFAENVKETEQTLNLTQDMQAAAVGNKAQNGNIPLLIAIDQEGGIVYRLGSGTALPGNMALGATRDPELARQAGEIIGRELSALGINVDFAPVLDTNNNPQNPVIGLRSFSSDPELVSSLGIPLMQGIQAHNVAVAAKHFPGHGDTATDSHTGLPLVDKSMEELAALELAPFKAAMDSGVDMIMTAHIQYPQIEKDTYVSKKSGEEIHIPATLSDDILTGIVRNQYGYDGIIVTDAMGMDAISQNFGESEAAIMAIQAGVDIVLMPTVLRNKLDLAKIDAIIDDIEAAVAQGHITEGMLDDSVRRILRLKAKRGVLDFDLAARTAEAANQAVGSDLNRDLERQIAASAVTVVKNDDTILPFKVTAGDHVLLLGAYNNELPGLDLGMRRLQADGVIPADVTFETVRYNAESSSESLKESLDKASHIILVSEIGRESHLASDHWLTRVPTEVVDYANSQDKLVVVMSISKPYDVANYPAAKAIVAVYGNKGMDPTEALRPDNAFGPNIPAGVEVIFAGLPHKGSLPVDIPLIKDGLLSTDQVAYPIGFGLSYDEPAKGILAILPEAAKIGQEFPVTLELGDLKGIEKGTYQIRLHFDPALVDGVLTEGIKLEGNTFVVEKEAGDLSSIALSLKAKTSGSIAPILFVELVDQLGRIFSLGQAAYQGLTVLVTSDSKVVTTTPIDKDVKDQTAESNKDSNKDEVSTESTVSAEEESKKMETTTTQPVLPNTGDSQNISFLLLGLTGLASLAALKKKRS
ncbi:TPA: glycoside hydrolase family 3 N-terminal domain-containing protein [Streptococcus suis]